MTEWRNTDEADAAGGAPPAARARRRLLTRALPGGVAFFAALTVPEISVGAGDLAPGERLDEPVKPVPRAGQAAVKPGLAGVSPALAGVRYAPLLRLPETAPAQLAAPVTAAAMTPGLPDISIAPEFAPAAASLPVEVAADAAPSAEAPAFVAVPPDADAVLQLSAQEIVPDEAPAPVEEAAPPPAAPLPAALVSPQPEAPALPAGAGSEREAFFAAPAAIDPPVAGLGEGLVPEEQAVLAASAPVRQERAALTVAPVVSPPAALAPLPPVARPAPRPAAAPPASASPVQAAGPAMPVAPVAAAAIPAAKPTLTAAKPGNNTISTDAMFGLDIKSQLVTRVDGKTAGAVDFRQTATGLSVRLGSIVDVLADRYDPAQIARIRASSAANAYIPLAELQAQGIPISYDPVYDEFNVGHTDTRPKAGRKVHIDQITAPERGLGSTGMGQVRR